MRFAASLIALGVLLVGSDPYDRSHVNTGDPNSHCFWWPAGTVTFQQSQKGNTLPSGNDPTNGNEFGAITRAYGSWQAITNGGSNLNLVEGPHSLDRTVGYDSSNPGANANVILFRDQLCTSPSVVPTNDPCFNAGSCGNAYDCWSYSNGTIALTTSTYDRNTGQLFDADVEFDGAGFYFTVDDGPACTSMPYSQNCVAYDVQNTMTHEAGHFLGLDHTTYPGSIMNPTAPIGETSKRTIDPGSRQFIADAYPQGQASKDCVAAAGKSGGCSTAGSGPETMLVAIALWLSLRARTTQERRPRA